MKHLTATAMILLLSFGIVRSETLDDAFKRFLAGEMISEEEAGKLTDTSGPASEGEGVDNFGSRYLKQIKRSVVAPVRNGGWPLRSSLVYDEKSQRKTYQELKAIYEKNKSPIVAYALVCPAMMVDDMEILPELFAKIAENKALKAHFDKVYATLWKPRLDPDF